MKLNMGMYHRHGRQASVQNDDVQKRIENRETNCRKCEFRLISCLFLMVHIFMRGTREAKASSLGKMVVYLVVTTCSVITPRPTTTVSVMASLSGSAIRVGSTSIA